MNIEVSVVTPTYNRRMFIPTLIEIYRNQLYPKEKMEWIIIDDGRQKVEDLFEEASKTIPNIRYINFQYELNLANPNLVQVSMTGEATSYDAITLQSDLFNQNRFIRNPIFSNFSLNRDGLIDFDLSFDVSRSLVSFEQEVERSRSR
jgi:glycosyltransferase involved in cell wall biosynthesis